MYKYLKLKTLLVIILELEYSLKIVKGKLQRADYSIPPVNIQSLNDEVEFLTKEIDLVQEIINQKEKVSDTAYV